jgi:tetratricopeptide (TPR) repeat protein
MFSLSPVGNRRVIVCVALAMLSFTFVRGSAAQGGATNYLGNGGIHTIQGRIYATTGRRSEATGLKIRLHNVASNELSIIADGSGSFIFKNLIPGSYTVQLEGGPDFENAQETVVIDDPGSSNLSATVRLRGGAKMATVQIFLKPKPGSAAAVANEVINAKLASVPKAARELYDAAQLSIKEKNDQKAITQLREALALHQAFSPAWNSLGLLLQKTGDNKGSVDAFRSAVRHDPESIAANLNLGCALYNDQAYPEAERHLTEALVRNPALYRGHYYMGLTQLKRQRLDIAEQAFRKAVEVGDQQSAMAHYMLGGIYWSVKRYKDAADELEKYLKLEPNSKDAAKTRESIIELRNKAN